ncbi:MAG: sigma-70 family RNA polymerase sigma factor [Dysgonamonadaceae bacterium]|jgi:RNA polymerase sigma-70 factor (ECF subfamily)|nr:sigma-70 family RNA polymerase sigma factor [Dysgonamonadaceae bacterium]
MQEKRSGWIISGNNMRLLQKNYAEKSDEELMSLLVRSEQAAFDELYRRYAKPLLNFFFRMLGGEREKAEDFLHDLFLKIIEKPESFDRSRRFNTWFYNIAANMVKNEYRNAEIRRRHEQFLGNIQSETEELNSESIDKQQFENCLQNEIAKLDAETKILFNLRFREEMSVKQIAETLEIPEGTVKSRLHHLAKNLAKKLSIFKLELN